MILPITVGFVVGRFVRKKSEALLVAIVIGSVLGIVASNTLIPLLYPLFWGEAGYVIIPEARVIGIMVLIPDLVVYSEVVWRTRTFVISLVFLLSGTIFSTLGAWMGSRLRGGNISNPFEDFEG
ncbi:MAG: hypothetical protein ACFFE1_15190 [Candidatus Thorarchaeota archaeon]